VGLSRCGHYESPRSRLGRSLTHGAEIADLGLGATEGEQECPPLASHGQTYLGLGTGQDAGQLTVEDADLGLTPG